MNRCEERNWSRRARPVQPFFETLVSTTTQYPFAVIRSSVSPRCRVKGHSHGIGNTGDGYRASTPTSPMKSMLPRAPAFALLFPVLYCHLHYAIVSRMSWRLTFRRASIEFCLDEQRVIHLLLSTGESGSRCERRSRDLCHVAQSRSPSPNYSSSDAVAMLS